MIGFDFADPESGISATLRPSGAAVVFDHDDVIAASTEAEPDESGDEGVIALELDGASVRVELTPIGVPIALRGERAGSEQLSVCRVLGDLRIGGESRQVSCLGIRTEEAGAPDDGEVGLTRSIAVAFSDGGILALRAARPAGAGAHDTEEVVAALAGPDAEPVEVPEALLSTQYDGEGRQVRATVELWPQRDSVPHPARRAAGRIVCGTSLSLGERRLDIAIFRWSMEGRPGLGRYEIISAAGR